MRKVIKTIFFVGICCGWSLVYGDVAVGFYDAAGRALPPGTTVSISPWSNADGTSQQSFSQGRVGADGKIQNLRAPGNSDYIVKIDIPGHTTIKHTFTKGTLLAPKYVVTNNDIKLGSSPGSKPGKKYPSGKDIAPRGQ